MKAKRIIKTKVGEYEAIEWDGVNRSGIYPVSREILVLVDQVPEKTSGGIILTESVRDVNTAAVTTGVIVEYSPGAFQYGKDGYGWSGPKPKKGERVLFERYAGVFEAGADGLMYRIMSDSAIGGLYIESPDDPRVKEIYGGQA